MDNVQKRLLQIITYHRQNPLDFNLPCLLKMSHDRIFISLGSTTFIWNVDAYFTSYNELLFTTTLLGLHAYVVWQVSQQNFCIPIMEHQCKHDIFVKRLGYIFSLVF
jgi:hypothetical protein